LEAGGAIGCGRGLGLLIRPFAFERLADARCRADEGAKTTMPARFSLLAVLSSAFGLALGAADSFCSPCGRRRASEVNAGQFNWIRNDGAEEATR